MEADGLMKIQNGVSGSPNLAFWKGRRVFRSKKSVWSSEVALSYLLEPALAGDEAFRSLTFLEN